VSLRDRHRGRGVPRNGGTVRGEFTGGLAAKKGLFSTYL